MLDLKMMTFLKVAELRNYTASAEALHLSQPAVTQQIHKLEQYYQCKLIRISGRSVFLTAEGEALLHYANLQLSNETLLKERLREVKVPLRIGATLSIADYYLPQKLIPYLNHTSMQVSVAVGNTKNLLDRLLHAQLDCAFIEGLFDAQLFEAEMFCEADFCPVAKADHPLAGKKISLSDCHPYPLVLREEGSGTRAILENYLYRQNDSIHSFERTMEIGSFKVIKEYLEYSDGISFMYEAVFQKEMKRGKLIKLDLKDSHVSHVLHFVYLKNSMKKAEIKTFYNTMNHKEEGEQ